EVRVRPPTVREPPVGVLLRPTRSLGHTVEADELRYDNPHDAHSHNREQRLTNLQTNPTPKTHRHTHPPTTTAPTESRRFPPGARRTAREPPPPADSTRPLQGRGELRKSPRRTRTCPLEAGAPTRGAGNCARTP